MTRQYPHPHPADACTQQPWHDEDGSGRVTCLFCSHVFDQGRGLVPTSARVPLVHGRVHDLVLLPDDDDDAEVPA